MAFLHNGTKVKARLLLQNGNKSSYVDGDSFTGHLKALSTDDRTFDTSGISGASFKFTMKQKTNLKQGEILVIDGIKYEIAGVRNYTGVSFDTSKILLTLE